MELKLKPLMGGGGDRESDKPSRVIVYHVSGLPPQMVCIIGHVGITGKPSWYAHLYSHGEFVANLAPSDSAENTLMLIEQHLSTGIPCEASVAGACRPWPGKRQDETGGFPQ